MQIFYITDNIDYIDNITLYVSLRLLHKTMKKLNSKLDNDTRRFFKFHLVAL